MTAKEWLSRGRGIDREINSTLEMKRKARESLTKTTQSFDQDIVSGTHDPHKYDLLVELTDKADRLTDELFKVRNEIFDVITELPNRNQRIVLQSYYLSMFTWEQTAAIVHYSTKHTRRIHRDALKEMTVLLIEKGLINCGESEPCGRKEEDHMVGEPGSCDSPSGG